MKENKQMILIEGVLTVSTLIVVLYSYFYKEMAFVIFASYAVTIVILCGLLNVYLLFSRKKQKELNIQRIRGLINNINANTIVWSKDFSYIEANTYLKRTLGFAENEPATSIMRRLFNDYAFSEEGIRKLLSNDIEEIKLTDKDGKQCFTLWNTSVMESSKDGNDTLISIGFDLTEIKLMQKKLYASEHRYAISMELSEIGIMLNQKGNDTYYISKELREMLGFESHTINVNELRERVHPKDKMRFDTYVVGLYQADTVYNQIHSLELRLMSADGTYHWYLYRYKIDNILKDNESAVGGAFMDITKDKEKDMLIERMAYTDEITEIPNRNRIMTMGEETYDCCKELGYSYWVIVLDIDRFHIVNDTCGYNEGNKVLKQFAEIIYKYISFGGGIAARIGGDNFAIIIRNYGDAELPKHMVERIQIDFAKLATGKYANHSFSCSAGYSKMPNDGNTFAEVLDHAEFALSSGEKNKATIIRYDHYIHDEIIDGSELEKRLADAIENNELRLFYQPKISLATGKIIGVEALIRWIKPDGTIVQPGKFVPIAEKSHLIEKISHFVLYEACRQNKEWQDRELPKILMSINFTSNDFYQKDVRETVCNALVKTGMPSDRLEMELTESMAMKDIDTAVEQMNSLRKMGIKLAMDDFGTGYSSLSYIQIMPITLLKLDRSFIINIETDEIAQQIVRAVINIARSKKIETIAEGIENENQARILKEMGCQYAQGYLYGKPMPADKLAEYIVENNKNPWNIGKE